MMNRHELREHIFELLFRVEFHDPDEMPSQEELFRASLEDAEDEDWDYIRDKYEKTAAVIPELDALIDEASKGWKVGRLGKAELAILRLAVYEMEYDDDIPVGVAANEAVELAKKYGGEDSPVFINGILGKIAKGG